LIFRRKADPEAELAQALRVLRERLEQGLADIRREALASGPEGDSAWDRRLEGLGIRPESPEQRRGDALDGFTQSAGAPLGEVERACRAWCEELLVEAGHLQDLHPFSSELRGLIHELHHRAERESAAYAAEVKPRPTLDSVFATALGSSVRHLAQVGARRMTTLRCLSCGSPRSHDEETVCRYCASQLFG